LDLFGDPKKNPKGWKLKGLAELSEVSGGVTLNSQRRNNKTNLLPYLRVANVFRNKLDLSEVKYIHVSSQETERYLLKKNDVLIVEGHGNKEEIGRTSVWNEELSICVHQNHIIKIRPNAQLLNSYYLSYFLNLYDEHGYFSSKSVTTSGLNTININKVRNVKLPIPKFELQQQFCEFVRRTEAICQNQRQSNNEINYLFNALVQKAFMGELVHLGLNKSNFRQ